MSQYFDAYSSRLSLCMMTYQFIEYGLRFCLHRCHAAIKYRLDGHLHYEAPLKAIEDAALGRLVEWYKGFTTNQDLIKELRSIKAERDRIAHQGYVLTLEEQRDDSFLVRESEKLAASHAKAKACLDALHKEMEHTDKVINEVYASYRAQKQLQGEALAQKPTIEGTSDAPPSAS